MKSRKMIWPAFAVLLLAGMLTACGGNGNNPTATPDGKTSTTGEAVPSVTDTVTPEITEPVSVTPTPSPTPEAELPEGFPKDVLLIKKPENTAEELRKRAEEQVKKAEEYRYRVTTVFSEQKQDSFCPGEGTVYFDFDKEEKYYEDDPEKCLLRVCYLNDVIVFSCFRSDNARIAECKGIKYYWLAFSETDADGRKYTYKFSNCSVSDNKRFELNMTCDWEDGNGTSFQANYDPYGYLQNLSTTTCDTEGRVTEQVTYQYHTIPNRRYSVRQRNAFVYGDDGNLTHREEYYADADDVTYDYTYEKDDLGRVCAYTLLYTRKGQAPEEDRTEISFPTDNTILYLNNRNTMENDDGSRKETGTAHLYLLGEETRRKIMNGFCFADPMQTDDGGDSKLLSDGIADLSVTDKLVYYMPWHECEYKNGRLVRTRTYVSGPDGESADYEYDSAGRLVRKHEYLDILGERITTYSYDNKGRLVREENKESYRYYSGEFSYDPDDLALNVTKLTVYTYDTDGNLTGKKITVTHKGKSAVTELYREENTYDAEGFLIQSEGRIQEEDHVWTVKAVGERRFNSEQQP